MQIANSTQEFEALIKNCAPGLVTSEQGFADHLNSFAPAQGMTQEQKQYAIESAHAHKNGGITHFYYRDIMDSMSRSDFADFLAKLGIGPTLFFFTFDYYCKAPGAIGTGTCQPNKNSICHTLSDGTC